MNILNAIHYKLLLSAIAALLTSACVTGPTPPLMSLWDEVSRFGYSSRDMKNSRVEVSYVTPFLRTHLKSTRNSANVKKRRALAEDMALWRAVDIAKDRKYAALKIVETRSDVTIERYDDQPRIRRSGLAHRHGGYLYDQSRTPRFRSTWIQAKAVIVVILKRVADYEDLDAAETAFRLAKKHPGARTVPAF